METNYDIISDGHINVYEKIISPKEVVTIQIKHNLERTKGIVYAIPSSLLKEKFIYLLDNLILYNGEDNIEVNLYNYGNKSLTVEDRDVVCTLILNKIEETDND
jgi:dUTPase